MAESSPPALKFSVVNETQMHKTATNTSRNDEPLLESLIDFYMRLTFNQFHVTFVITRSIYRQCQWQSLSNQRHRTQFCRPLKPVIDLVYHAGVTALQISPHAIQWLAMSYLSLQPDARIQFPPQKTIVESSLFVGIPFPKWRAFLTIWSMEENSFRLQHELIDSNLNWKKHTHEIGNKI